MSKRADALVGQVVAQRYTVVRRIGRGGMGAIYEVRHRKLGRSFALKTLAADLAADAEALARFRREADAIARLRHPNIIDIVDWDTLPDGAPCMIMELLGGETLAAYLRRRGPMPWRDIAGIADQICSALSAAHRAGITHRDIKPDNVFLATEDTDRLHVKLLDFGISKVHEGHSALTSNHQILGTPAYMSPEQIEGRQDLIGPAADVWATGAILFELATGRGAFRGPTVPSILYQVCHGAIPTVSATRTDAPPAFDALVGAALSRDPSQRPSIDQLRLDVRAALSDAAPTPLDDPDTAPLALIDPLVPLLTTSPGASNQMTAVSPAASARRPPPDPAPGRRRLVLALAAAAVVLAVGITAWAYYRESLAARLLDLAAKASREDSPADAPPPPDAPAPVTVLIESSPPYAKIFEGTAHLANTPHRLDVEPGAARELVLRLPGHHDEPVRIDGTTDRFVPLRPLRPPKPPARPRPRATAPKPPPPPSGPGLPDPDTIYGKEPRRATP